MYISKFVIGLIVGVVATVIFFGVYGSVINHKENK